MALLSVAVPVLHGSTPTPAPGALHDAVVNPRASSPRAETNGTPALPASTPLGSTPTNRYIANWSTEGTIAVDPIDPARIVASAIDLAPAAANNTTVYSHLGVDGAFATEDGGLHWSSTILPASPAWSDPSSPEWCHIHFGNPSVVYAANGTVYDFDLTSPWEYASGCPSTNLQTLGLVVTISRDGGSTWGAPVTIRGNESSYSVDKPWGAVDPTTGEVYVGYVDDFNGGINVLQNSTDGGLRWSAPVQVSSSSVSGSMRGAQVAVDPNGGVDDLWVDQTTGALYFARSTDHGASFGRQVHVATAVESVYSTIAPAGLSPLFPSMAVGPSLGASGRVPLYAVWQNGSGGAAGNPAIDLSWSDDNGTSWSAPVAVDLNRSGEGFLPYVSVTADGTVYVVWYSMDPTKGTYRFVAAVSHDDGRSFDAPFNVSNVDSSPNYGTYGYVLAVGDNSDLVAEGTSARAVWADARSTEAWNVSAPALGARVVNTSLYTALLVNDTVNSSVPQGVGITIGGTLAGATGPALDVNLTPIPLDWIAGADYAMEGPTSISFGGQTWTFAYWYDSLGSPGPAPSPGGCGCVNGTVVPDDHFTACYLPVGQGLCHGPGAPGLLQVTTVPSGATVRVDGLAVPSVHGVASALEPAGVHAVTATAGGYAPESLNLTVLSGQVTSVNVTLSEYSGSIAGVVAPANGTLLFLDSSYVPIDPNGSFSWSVRPGVHSLGASSPGYYSWYEAVNVTANATDYLRIQLAPIPCTLIIHVTPLPTVFTINGVPTPLSNGTSSVYEPPGVYWLNASRSGYRTASVGPLALDPGDVVPVWLNLTRYAGSLAVTVDPPNATLALNGTRLTPGTGPVLLTLPWGPYRLTASAPARQGASREVEVVANSTTSLDLALPFAVGWLTGEVSPTTASLTIDGHLVGLGPDGQWNVTAAPGPHDLNFSSPGFSPAEESVLVTAGNATALDVHLVPSFDVFPYLFVGISAAAILVVAVSLVIAWRTVRRSGAELPPGPPQGDT